MDNKLSELSKPVGFVSDRASTQLKEGYPASIRPFFDVQGSSPLYSQEYVSALLADNEAKDKRIAEAEVRGVEKLAAAFKSWASDETFPDCEAQRHWATASREALSFAGDLRNGSCDDR